MSSVERNAGIIKYRRNSGIELSTQLQCVSVGLRRTGMTRLQPKWRLGRGAASGGCPRSDWETFSWSPAR